jgi:hypothetical protein
MLQWPFTNLFLYLQMFIKITSSNVHELVHSAKSNSPYFQNIFWELIITVMSSSLQNDCSQ